MVNEIVGTIDVNENYDLLFLDIALYLESLLSANVIERMLRYSGNSFLYFQILG
jgi:hypothetical protein